ncbi:MAG: GNAT family N-acetyltransferase [Myxococcales bacterium]|nr:GNAT family N-acetyltransferase [Myxococcales bacterium]
MVRVARVDIASPLAARLIARLDAELSATYPEEGATHFRLDGHEVAPGRGGFFVMHVDGVPSGPVADAVACGALRLLDAEREASGVRAELKRMFVVPEARGRGLSRVLLAALEGEARALGASAVVLETGARQTAAIALYRSSGYRDIEPFGEYVGSPLSLCLGKPLR